MRTTTKPARGAAVALEPTFSAFSAPLDDSAVATVVVVAGASFSSVFVAGPSVEDAMVASVVVSSVDLALALVVVAVVAVSEADLIENKNK